MEEMLGLCEERGPDFWGDSPLGGSLHGGEEGEHPKRGVWCFVSCFILSWLVAVPRNAVPTVPFPPQSSDQPHSECSQRCHLLEFLPRTGDAPLGALVTQPRLAGASPGWRESRAAQGSIPGCFQLPVQHQGSSLSLPAFHFHLAGKAGPGSWRSQTVQPG